MCDEHKQSSDSNIENQSHKPEAAGNAANTTAEEGEAKKASGVTDIPAPTPNVPPTPTNPPETKARCKQWIQENKIYLELIGIGIGVIGVIVLAFQSWLMVRATKANENAVAEMRQQRIDDARAWISADVKFERIVNDNAKFTVTFKNTGRTPAVNVQQIFISHWNVGEIPKKDVLPDPRVSAGVIGPDSSFFSDLWLPMESLKNVGTAYLYGTVWYDDIFGNHHWTRFCQTVRCDTNLTIHGEAALVHNSCDDVESEDN